MLVGVHGKQRASRPALSPNFVANKRAMHLVLLSFVLRKRFNVQQITKAQQDEQSTKHQVQKTKSNPRRMRMELHSLYGRGSGFESRWPPIHFGLKISDCRLITHERFFQSEIQNPKSAIHYGAIAQWIEHANVVSSKFCRRTFSRCEYHNAVETVSNSDYRQPLIRVSSCDFVDRLIQSEKSYPRASHEITPTKFQDKLEP